LQSSHWRVFGPRFIAQVLGVCGPRGRGGRGSRRWKGRAEAGAPRRMVRRAVADWPGAASWRPLCPAGASLEKNGRFRWAAGGCWGLQMGYGVEKMSLETINGRKFTVRGWRPR
jgi:hypothetical protein